MSESERPMTRPGRMLAEAVDDLWTEIRAEHPDVPDCAIFVSPVAHGMDTKKFHVLGHFARERWQVPGQEKAMGEIVVVAEHLARGGTEVLATVLHEAAHAMCAFRGVEDTSQGGRYHNAKFAAAARELGLDVASQGGRGLAATSLAEGTAEKFATAVKALDAAVIQAKAQRRQDEDRPSRSGPVKAVCTCDPVKVMRISPSQLLRGVIRCEDCGEAFRAEEATDGDG